VKHFILLGALLLAACRSSAPLAVEPPVRGTAELPHILSLDQHGEGISIPAIAELDFLVGRWEGEAFGSWAEENWAPARGGTMLGSFRLVKDGAPLFYELMVLAELEGRPQIRVKHFGPGMEPWEEGAESENFPLIDVEGTTAWFGGATYHRVGDELWIYLAMNGGDDGSVEELLRFRLAD
jgi:hypothetical protein